MSVITFKTIYRNVILTFTICPVGWGCRIHRLHLCKGVRPPPNRCPIYYSKQSNGEDTVMLELWGNVEYPFITIALDVHVKPKVVTQDKVLSIDQIELFYIQTERKQMTYAKLNR